MLLRRPASKDPAPRAAGTTLGLLALGAGGCQVPYPDCALQALLEEEPRDHLRTAVRQLAMDAIAALRYLPIPPGHPCPRGPCPPVRGLEALLPAPVSDRPLSLCSSVETVLEGQKESLIHACFTSVFLLPPEEDMQGLDASLYFQVSAG